MTITQVQALRAARNAGITVPPEAIKKAIKYLEESTNDQGGVIYSLAGGGGGDGRPALTAAAISCGFSAGEYNSPLVKKWLKFCQGSRAARRRRALRPRRVHPLLLCPGHLHPRRRRLRQAVPGVEGADRLTWSKYRKPTRSTSSSAQQSADGSWTGGHVGPSFITAVHLTILQLDNACLPIYQR